MKRIEKMNIPEQLVQKLVRMQILYDNELHNRLLTAKIKSQLTENEIQTLKSALEAEGMSVLDIGVHLAFDADIFGEALTFEQLSSPELYGELVIVESSWDELNRDEDVTSATIYQVLETDEDGDVKITGGISNGTYYIEPDDLDDEGDEEYRIWAINGLTKMPNQEQQETAIVAAQPAALDPVDQAKQLHQRILADAQSAAESIWDMSQAIKEMRDGKHYKALLFDNFEGYCEEALGMSRSHAYRYIQIAEGMSAENVSQLAQIGTTKLALLASVTDEQREIVTTAVDVESATVKELKAEIDKLQGKVKQAEQEKLAAENMQSIERSHRKEADAAFERAQSRIRVLEAEKQQNADRKELLDAADNQIRRLNAEIANNSDYIAKLQEKITELENRPVEVAVQDNSAELERIRKEYEEKLAEQDKARKKLEDELNQRDDNDHFLRLDINYREARVKVQTLCTMVANLNDGKEKETLKQNIRNIIHDIEQRIGKE